MDWGPFLVLCFIGGALTLKPTLRPHHETVEKSQNDTLIVTCKAENEDVSWTGPNGRAIPSLKGRVHTELREGHGRMLVFEGIEFTDRGRYTCTSASKESATFELSVLKTSKFVNTPTEHRVTEYLSTVIRCEVEGEPKPTITWQKNGKNVDSIPGKNYATNPKGLHIMNATKADAGVFTCRAIQLGREDSSIKTLDITLKVQHKPEWKDPVEGNTVVYGYVSGETNLTCEAVAQPEANYTWLRDNRNVKTLKLNATEIRVQDKSVLQILINDNTVFGAYQCQAKNKLGSISKGFDLQKGEKPDPPTAFRLVQTTVHTATLKIASEVPDLAGYRVQFVITPPGQDVSWESPEFQDIPKTDTGHYEVRDLLEDTPYTVRVATRSLAGLSDFTTSTVTLRTLRIGEVPSSSARVSFLKEVLFAGLLALSAVH